MLGRIVRSADFERVLGLPTSARSPHFALHFLAGAPSRGARAGAASAIGKGKLSTSDQPSCTQPVDDLPASSPRRPSLPQAWLGTVVPKRHAKRAVTRNLLKRQIRAAMLRREDAGAPIAPGLWVIRLRAPFDRQAFASAASAGLRSVARAELDELLVAAARRLASPVAGTR